MAVDITNVISREFVQQMLVGLNRVTTERDSDVVYRDRKQYEAKTKEQQEFFRWFDACGVSLNYSISKGYWISDEDLSEFRTQARIDAEKLVVQLNELLSKQRNCRTDAKRAEYSDMINPMLAQLQATGIQYSFDEWRGSYELPRTEAQARKLAADLREYYQHDVESDIARKRAELKTRIDSEIRALTHLQQQMADGDWEHIWESDLTSSNRDDMIKLMREQKVMAELAKKLG